MAIFYLPPYFVAQVQGHVLKLSFWIPLVVIAGVKIWTISMALGLHALELHHVKCIFFRQVEQTNFFSKKQFF